MVSESEKQKIRANVLKALESDRQRLLMKQPFIASVMMQLELVPVFDSRVPTACTDGVHVFVSCRFYASLTEGERMFVLAHEVWHTVLMHAQREMGRDHRRFNYATDLEIHFVLAENGFEEPFVLPHDPLWAHRSAEEIYESLKRADLSKKKNGKTSGNIKAVRPDGGMDPHLTDEDAAEARKQAAGGQLIEIDPDFRPILPSAASEKIRCAVIQAAQRMERMQGRAPCAMQKLIERLRSPELNWKELLKQFVTSCFGGERHWLPPSRRYIGSGLYLPSRRDKCLTAYVALDTSGSMMNDLPMFFAELEGLLRSFGRFELTVIQCDAEIHSVEKFTENSPLPRNREWKAAGLGGTDFRPVFDYISKKQMHPNVLIYLTDGYGTAPDHAPEYPVMWVLTSDGKLPVQWGRIVRMGKKAAC